MCLDTTDASSAREAFQVFEPALNVLKTPNTIGVNSSPSNLLTQLLAYGIFVWSL